MPHSNSGSSEGGNPNPLSTSKSLLGRARDGDAIAWDRLSLLYAPLVFHLCRRRGLRDPDAADVVQDVFQAVATHLGAFRKGYATEALKNGVDTVTVAHLLGHADASMISRVYAKVQQDPRFMAEAARRAKGLKADANPNNTSA